MSAGTNKAFKAGRDLAVDMLRAGANQDIAASSIEAQDRDGRPQNNWALLHVHRLLERPELAEGFSAVLSDYIGLAGIITHPKVYANLTVGQMLGAVARS
jgi:hypothetical protein